MDIKCIIDKYSYFTDGKGKLRAQALIQILQYQSEF